MSDLNPYEEGLALELARAQALVEELEAACWRMREQRDQAIAWRDSDKDRADRAEAKLAKAVEALDDLISTYVWIREDEYERGWSEMSNAIHEATFVQMELKGQDDE